MENCISIGNKIEKETADNIADGIVKIFASAHENRIDQDVISTAINAFSVALKIENITITNSNFVGEDKQTIVNHTEKE